MGDVAGWSADTCPVATNLMEAAAWHKAIRPVCRCGHAVSFDPHGLWWHFERRGWNDALPDVRKRFWCTMCRSRARKKINPIKLELVVPSESDIRLPWPPHEVWNRVIRKMR